jgi:hypothetical protein
VEAVALVLDIDPLSLERETDKGMAGHGPWPSFRARSFPSKAKRVDFDRAVRPILAAKCLTCHGPDADARKAVHLRRLLLLMLTPCWSCCRCCC